MSQERASTDPVTGRQQQRTAPRSIFDVPAPIKQLFDKFPLVTYPINDLPQRAPRVRDTPILHVFTTKEGASRGAPSYNPACLKWQVWRTMDRGCASRSQFL
jgi:metaxin